MTIKNRNAAGRGRAQPGAAGHSLVWFGKARQGKARQGEAEHGSYFQN